MSCLKKIINIFILAFAIIGFISIGGPEWVLNMYEKFNNPSEESILEKVKHIGDFSEISDEFEIDKTASVFGYSALIAEHKASGQKFIIVNSKNKPILTPQDFKDDLVEEKVLALTKKYKYQALAVDEFEIIKKGSLKAYGKKAPYVRFNAKAKRIPMGNVSGVISVVDLGDNDLRLIVSANEKAKYSQLISEEFFRKIK